MTEIQNDTEKNMQKDSILFHLPGLTPSYVPKLHHHTPHTRTRAHSSTDMTHREGPVLPESTFRVSTHNRKNPTQTDSSGLNLFHLLPSNIYNRSLLLPPNALLLCPSLPPAKSPLNIARGMSVQQALHVLLHQLGQIPQKLCRVRSINVPMVARDGHGHLFLDGKAAVLAHNHGGNRTADRQNRASSRGQEGVESRDPVHAQVADGKSTRRVFVRG